MEGTPSHCSTEDPSYCLSIVNSALFSTAAKFPGPLNTTLDTMDRHREEMGLGRKELHTVSHKHTHIHSMQTHMFIHTSTCKHFAETHFHEHKHTHSCSKAQSWHHNGRHRRPDSNTSPYGVGGDTHPLHVHTHTQNKSERKKENKGIRPTGRQGQSTGSEYKRQTRESR